MFFEFREQFKNTFALRLLQSGLFDDALEQILFKLNAELRRARKRRKLAEMEYQKIA